MSRPDHADFCNKDHQPGATPCARIVPQAPALTTSEELDALASGTRVVDATSDIWTKVASGLWEHYGEFIPSTSLAVAWGPLKIVGAAV